MKNTSQHPAFFITRLLRISGRPEPGWALNFRTLWFPGTVCLFSKSQVRCSLKIPHLERGSSAEPRAVQRVKAAAVRDWFSNTTCSHSIIVFPTPKTFTFRFCFLSCKGKC